MELVASCVLSLVCIAYNNTINRWPPFQGLLYVPLNIAFATGVTIFGFVVIDLSAGDIGLRGDAGDAWLGLLAALALTGPLFVLATSRHAARIADRRVADLRGSALAYQVLVRVPVGTAVAEEMVFRGVVFASWRATGLPTVPAILVAAAVFGLWHISPTVNLVRANAPDAARRTLLLSILGAIAFTTAAGIALTWLRLETDGLLASIVLHGGSNSLSTLAAVAGARRSSLSARRRARPD